MSEYQYYEFLAIDRPLNAEALAYVRTLSRRVQPTATQASFTYSYGDFPSEPLKLLAKHYDVMLYLANWGSKQLAFRLPKGALDEQALRPYMMAFDEIELTTAGEYVILNIAFQDEGDEGWLAGEGLLGSLAPLRDDLLRGDLRTLYLAWLAAAERNAGAPSSDDDDDDDWADEDRPDDESDESVDPDELREPPVPPGLGQLSGSLRAFIEFFDIDQDLVGAAAQGSAPLKASSEPVERWVTLLPEAERNAFLVRAARGEQISAVLLRRLRELGGGQQSAPADGQRRTFSTLMEIVTVVRSKREAKERAESERARIAKLEALAKREPQVWTAVEQGLAQRNSAGYGTAVAYLVELRDLAAYRNQQAIFDERLRQVIAPYATSVALQRRLKEAGLVV